MNNRFEFLLEGLETRTLLAVDVALADDASGVLRIIGDNADNEVSVEVVGDNVVVSIADGEGVQQHEFASSEVTSLYFLGKGGDDSFENLTNLESLAYGNEGNDLLIGGSNSDALHGGAGNDVIEGGDGDDSLHGDSGNDRLYGGRGEDKLYGWTGNDELDGGDDDDYLSGYSGNDKLIGGLGDDDLHGHTGNDELDGGDGHDKLYGFRGNDVLRGGNGNDYLGGWSGNDDMDGGEGDDMLYGNYGDDTMIGGGGHDILVGREGRDNMQGGSGRDILIGGDGSDHIVGDGEDDILIDGNTTFELNKSQLNDIRNVWTSVDSFNSRKSQLEAGVGPDGVKLVLNQTVFYDNFSDVLSGGDGNNWIFANTGRRPELNPGQSKWWNRFFS
jgi:Ca2+-binding RTX toxin-like protein